MAQEIKVSVITCAYRDLGLFQEQMQGIADQAIKEVEWIVVDDRLAPECPNQRGYVLQGKDFPVLHVPPRRYSPDFAAASAWNTGLLHARGKLAYFMNEYVTLGPDTLAKHWRAYEMFGPKVIISGPLNPEPESGHGHSRHPERMLEGGIGEIVDDDLLGGWYWAGRNDSADLATAIACNGFDERCDGQHGGQDVEFARRMVTAGCRYLFVTDGEAFMHTYSGSKGGQGQKVGWNILYNSAKAGRTWAQNDWVIANERTKAAAAA